MGTDTVRTDGRPTRPPERRREQRGWYFYDWACSVYSTSVLTVFLGPYLTRSPRPRRTPTGFVHPLGIPVRAGSFFAYSVSAVGGAAVLVMPLAGAAADRTGRKKPLLGGGRLCGRRARRRACSSWTATAICWAALLLIVANASLSVSMVLYNSYLPQIAGARGARRGLLARLGLRLRGGLAGPGR